MVCTIQTTTVSNVILPGVISDAPPIKSSSSFIPILGENSPSSSLLPFLKN
jgi:hypothetical protein